MSGISRFAFKERRRFLQRLKTERFDVLVIGGGINGTGILRDLSLRTRSAGPPLRVALIEKSHFGTSASSKNSHLIHGGLRYLKYFHVSLVREALHERATLLAIAPHRVFPQSFILPVYGKLKGWYYQAGVTLYDLLAGARKIGVSRRLDRQEILRVEPDLKPDGLAGALVYYDARMEAAKLLLDQLREAVERGALAANFVEFQRHSPGGAGLMQIDVRDTLTGEEFTVRAQTVVQTVGPWETAVRLRLVRGSHLIFPRLTRSEHALAFFEEQGRIIFVLPFGPGGQFSLVGTTEKEQNTPEPVEIDREEEEYLRRQIRQILPESVPRRQLGAFSALRPLIHQDGSRSASALSREHEIWKSAPNVYHVAGGKYTTFRLIAQQVVDMLGREHFLDLGPCSTGQTPIDGNTSTALEELGASRHSLAEESCLRPESMGFLINQHGRRTPEILSLCRTAELREPLVPGLPYLRAEMLWASQNEMTGRLEDFLSISTPLRYIHRWSPAEEERLQRWFEAM